MEELKPCPFCGGEARYNCKQINPTRILVGYDCVQCGAAAPVFTGTKNIESEMRLHAKEAWNRRSAPENTSEVVKKLWALYDKYEDAEHVVCGDAAKLLTAAPENKPLTLDQLRQMDGKPVWVISLIPGDTDNGYWAIVSADLHYSHNVGGAISKATDGVAVAAIAYLEDYGKTWLAYVRKPEGSA